jgi:hypothetical protein
MHALASALVMQAGALWQHFTQLLDLFDCAGPGQQQNPRPQ